jgi:hypothetical protein
MGLGTRTLLSNVDQASPSHPATGSPMYDEAHLKELKASTPSFRPTISTGDDRDLDTPITSMPGDTVMESLADSGNIIYSGLLQITSVDFRFLFRRWRSGNTLTIICSCCQGKA